MCMSSYQDASLHNQLVTGRAMCGLLKPIERKKAVKTENYGSELIPTHHAFGNDGPVLVFGDIASVITSSSILQYMISR
jgi:hypothetical protein